jgi:hypothetical protein
MEHYLCSLWQDLFDSVAYFEGLLLPLIACVV